MRKVFLSNLVSLDGYFEGPNKELDWHNVDKEFDAYAVEMLNSVDTLLFGRVTYELMARFWSSPDALREDPVIAERMNVLPKVVFSRTLDHVAWNNTRLVKEGAAEEVKKLKQKPGKDIAIFGSSDLALSLITHNVIDECRIMVNPVVLGSGKSLFKGIKDRLILELLNVRTFHSGNVLLTYAPRTQRSL